MKTKNTLSQWIDGKSDFPEHIEGKDTFEKIKRYSAQLEAPAFDKEDVFDKIKQIKAQKSQKTKTSYSKLIKIAAVIIVLIGVMAIIHQMSWQTTQTNFGQNQVVNLPDNSTVLVQAGSVLSYNKLSWFMTRDVKLDGEAFFELEKGKTFSVKTSVGNVEVLGTKFNVKSSKEKLNVVCYEGRVAVSQGDKKEIVSLNEFVIMKDNEVLNKNEITLHELPSQNNYFQIVDEEFESLIQDVKRYYNVKISVDNFKTNKHFTGRLPKNDVEKALDIISKTFKLKYKSANGNYYIFVDNANQ